ncbi:hypothetical protein [Citrobacter freundii]|jgi:hypothetical protein|nr:hypothetical protein [Citrobacter freundii]
MSGKGRRVFLHDGQMKTWWPSVFLSVMIIIALMAIYYSSGDAADGN